MPPDVGPGRRARDLPRAGARCSTSTATPRPHPRAPRPGSRPQERAGPLRPPRRDAPGVQLRLPRRATGAPRTCARSSRPRSRPPTPSAPRRTWVLSNHDVVRHASRLGLPVGEPRPNGIGADDPQPDARARPAPGPRGDHADAGAARRRLPLPGRGARPARARPTCPTSSARTRPSSAPSGKEIGRDGCRVPMPVGQGRAVVRLRPGRPDLAAAAGRLRRPTPSTSRRASPGSTLELYRDAAAHPPRARARHRRPATLVDGFGDDVVALRQHRPGTARRHPACVANLGAEPVALPDGATVARRLRSADRRRPGADRHHGLGDSLSRSAALTAD